MSFRRFGSAYRCAPRVVCGLTNLARQKGGTLAPPDHRSARGAGASPIGRYLVAGRAQRHALPTPASPMAMDTAAQSNKLMPFPGMTIRPHEARAYGQSLDAVMVQHPGLTSVARNKLPPGKFPKPWTEGALEPPPPLPADATWKDLLTHRSYVDKVEERTTYNAQIKEKKEEWWKDNNHLLFSIITESMEKTAPTLREILRERFHVADGYYSGCG